MQRGTETRSHHITSSSGAQDTTKPPALTKGRQHCHSEPHTNEHKEQSAWAKVGYISHAKQIILKVIIKLTPCNKDGLAAALVTGGSGCVHTALTNNSFTSLFIAFMQVTPAVLSLCDLIHLAGEA